MAEKQEVRVRVAPSPTGDPHVGTAYIALFDYVFARHAGDITGLRAIVSDEPSTQVRRLGWAGHIELTVALKRSPATLPQPADATARLQDGALEGSNVSAVETMVSMISAARQFEMQMRSMQTAEKDEQQAQQLLSLS